MRIVLAKIGTNPTVGFAVNEFAKYLKKIDRTLTVDERTYPAYDEKVEKVIFIGKIDDNYSDIDTIEVKIKDGAGYITGSNERSVLFAVYKTLESLGCKWIRPGVDGEFIPEKTLNAADFTLELTHTPPYYHRGICIEGANKYENAFDMIDWMPKVGLNEYFMQFHIPYAFFERWYTYHEDGAAPFTPEDAIYLGKRLDEEITLRGFKYQKVGHGWTYPLVGKKGYGWYKYEEEIPADVKEMFAEINGEREVWHGSLFDTNLCYSNPDVRKRFISNIVDYCEENPAVDYIHFWLADARNNQCECAECQKLRPSDYYVMILNELDEMLPAKGIKTKIVFLIYFELLWAPVQEKIKNQDRFVLMFAPISRSYTEAYTDALPSETVEFDPYVRNKITLPAEVNKNVYALRSWQKNFDGESFLFDYHVMWDFQIDAGCYRNARVMHEDMKNLDKLGLGGMVSCQLQRVSAPTCLSTYSMARALWDKNSEFDKVAKDYFTISFDRDADKVEAYMSALSEINDSDDADKYDKLIAKINETLPMIKENYERTKCGAENYHMSWAYLLRHAELWILIAETFKVKDDEAARDEKYAACCDYINSVEDEVQRGFDGWQYIYDVLKKRIGIFPKKK